MTGWAATNTLSEALDNRPHSHTEPWNEARDALALVETALDAAEEDLGGPEAIDQYLAIMAANPQRTSWPPRFRLAAALRGVREGA